MANLPPLPRGRIPLAPESAALLGGLASLRGRPVVEVMAPGPIEEVEAALRTPIPYDVLGLLAVEQRLPGALPELTSGIQTFYDAQERGLARELRFDRLVAFAFLVGTPDDWTDEPRFAAFARTADRNAPATFVRWDLRKPGVGGEPYSLARYLAERWDLRARGAPLELSIEAPVELLQYATHAKFGRGRVLARGDGKATVEFGDGTVRKIAESYLSFET